ncbi:hypothetical protein [Polaromonas sp. JS666]|uniref:hypothetical protein n=1 Tax=Polaromonas sp. (strain JS666 / ATCC BAA-500) TaxID=296591 RepID=UPI0018DE2CCB|nr:hypothetical protein [Polaromonas sp. JS666]
MVGAFTATSSRSSTRRLAAGGTLAHWRAAVCPALAKRALTASGKCSDGAMGTPFSRRSSAPAKVNGGGAPVGVGSALAQGFNGWLISLKGLSGGACAPVGSCVA